jgi:hypothetical protein
VTEGKDSRNPLLDLLVRAGYDKVRSGFDPKSRNRTDQVQQGDFVFRAVKAALVYRQVGPINEFRDLCCACGRGWEWILGVAKGDAVGW